MPTAAHSLRNTSNGDVRAIVRVGKEDLGLEFMPGQEARVAQLLYESRFQDQE